MNRRRPRESQTVLILFAAGAALVIAAFAFALVQNWRTFDPLVTASMIGVGLLLIVIYERLGHMNAELRTISSLLERLNSAVDAQAGRDPIRQVREPGSSGA